jgi:hypothetical protein
MDKKTICSLCQELREEIKYIEDDRVKNALNIIDSIQYRAHDMERGLYKSKQEVGKQILSLLLHKHVDNDIKEVITKRWPNLSD